MKSVLDESILVNPHVVSWSYDSVQRALENSVPIPPFAFLRLENGKAAGGRSPPVTIHFNAKLLPQ